MDIILNNQSSAIYLELLTNPKKHGLPFRSFKDCFEKSNEVTAQHILYKDYQPENPNCPKIFFYVVLREVFGGAYLKDKDGNLGYQIQYKKPNE